MWRPISVGMSKISRMSCAYWSRNCSEWINNMPVGSNHPKMWSKRLFSDSLLKFWTNTIKRCISWELHHKETTQAANLVKTQKPMQACAKMHKKLNVSREIWADWDKKSSKLTKKMKMMQKAARIHSMYFHKVIMGLAKLLPQNMALKIVLMLVILSTLWVRRSWVVEILQTQQWWCQTRYITLSSTNHRLKPLATVSRIR